MKNQMDDKIFLRILEEKDAEELFRRMLYNRNHLWPWINEMECLSEKHLRLQILSAAADYRSNQGMETGVFQENELIGMISFQMLSNVEFEKSGEIGLSLRVELYLYAFKLFTRKSVQINKSDLLFI